MNQIIITGLNLITLFKIDQTPCIRAIKTTNYALTTGSFQIKTNAFPVWLHKVTKTEACQSMSATLTGFLLMAPPTARTALGFPAISARRLYETVSPNFTSFRSVCNTRLVNASSPRSGGTGRKSGRQAGEENRESPSLNQSNPDSRARGWWHGDTALFLRSSSVLN